LEALLPRDRTVAKSRTKADVMMMFELREFEKIMAIIGMSKAAPITLSEIHMSA
jgi:hypothetical protein